MQHRKVRPLGYPPAEWVRVCITIDGFRLCYGRWPTRVRLSPAELVELVSKHLHPVGFAVVSSVVELSPDERGLMTAEDGTGAEYLYSRDGSPPDGDVGVPALEWFGRAVMLEPWE